MAKQEECSKCKRAKQGGYADEIKCSFYGRKPLFDNSPCPSFLNVNTKCPECGQEVPPSERVCPNCGCPIKEDIIPIKNVQSEINSNSNNSTSQTTHKSGAGKVLLFVLVGLALVAGTVLVMKSFYSDNTAHKNRKKTDSQQETTKTDDNSALEKEKYSTIEKVRANIEGTVWISDEPGYMGYKIVFKNGSIYVYGKLPNKYVWESSPSYVFEKYEICEDRYPDTGEKFVYIKSGKLNWDWENIVLIPSTGGCSLNNKLFQGIVHQVESTFEKGNEYQIEQYDTDDEPRPGEGYEEIDDEPSDEDVILHSPTEEKVPDYM